MYTLTLTLTIDWWLIPFAITVLSFGYACWLTANYPEAGVSGVGEASAIVFRFGFATIVSLVAWLLHLLLKGQLGV